MFRSFTTALFYIFITACTGSNGDISSSSEQHTALSSDSNTSSSASNSAVARCSEQLAQTNRNSTRDALEQFFIKKDLSAIDRFWQDPYIQHNPVAQSGVNNFRNAFQNFLGSIQYEIYGVFAECDLAVVFGRYEGTGVIFDMFRLEDGKFIEHWDSEPGTISSSTSNTNLFSENRDYTHFNRERIESLYEDVIIPMDYGSQAQNVESYLDNSRLIYRDYLGAQRGRAYQKIHYVIADGDFVFVLAEATVNNEASAIYELYQLEDGLIFSYWSASRSQPSAPPVGFPGIF